MNTRAIALALSVTAISACGAEGLNTQIEVTQTEEVAAANPTETQVNTFTGAWRISGNNSTTSVALGKISDFSYERNGGSSVAVYNDGSLTDCSEIINFTDDLTWTRVSSDHTSSGYYTVNETPDENTLGSISLTPTYANNTPSCFSGLNITVGTTEIIYFNDGTDDEVVLYSVSDDNFLEAIGNLSFDEELTKMMEELTDSKSAVSPTGERIGSSDSFEEIVGLLKESLNETVDEASSVEAIIQEVSTDEVSSSEESNSIITAENTGQDVAPDVGAALPETGTNVDTTPVVEEESDPVAVSNVESFSVRYRCDSCRILESRLTWTAETTDVEYLELFFVREGVRQSLGLLEPTDHTALVNLDSSYDLSDEQAGCFEVVSTSIDGNETTSSPRCFGIY